jgi:cytochrome oxidase Cu insertion factor (SCO1/SenC/PrrC family)
MRHALVLMFVVVSTALSLATQNTRARVDVSTLGPQVGERVPDFSLVDQAGRMRTLQSVMGSRGAMLVFLRSADW